MPITANVVYFDCADTWGTYRMLMRTISFYFEGNIIPLNYSDVSAVSTDEGASALLLFDNQAYITYNWYTETITNVRIYVHFNSTITFDEIRVFNGASSSGTQGVKTCRVYHTMDTSAINTTYGAPIIGGTEIDVPEFGKNDTGVYEQVIYSENVVEVIDIDLDIITTSEVLSELVKPSDGEVRSVLFDIKNAYNTTAGVGIRAIDFYFNNELIEVAEADFSATATGWLYTDDNFHPRNAFISALAISGAEGANGYRSELTSNTNQRLSVHFKEKIVFDKIVVHNYNYSSASSANLLGAKDVKITTSPLGYLSDVYDDVVEYGTTIFDGTFDAHINRTLADDQVIYDIGPADNPRYHGVYVDVTDNWGASDGVGIRSIEFFLDDVIVDIDSSGGHLAFGSQLGTTYAPLKSFDNVNTSKTGVAGNNQWLSATNINGSTRLYLLLNQREPLFFNKIVINNAHNSGGDTDYGAKNIKIIATEEATYEWEYDTPIPGGVVLFDGILPEHVALDQSDDFEVYNISLENRYIDGNVTSPIPEFFSYVLSALPLSDLDIIADINSPIVELLSDVANDAEFILWSDGSVVSPLSSTGGLLYNDPGPKTYTNGKPWNNQIAFNTDQPVQVGTASTGVSLPAIRTQAQVIVAGSKVHILGGYGDVVTPLLPTITADIEPDGTILSWVESGEDTYRIRGETFITKDRAFIVGGSFFGDASANVSTATINSDGSLGAWEPTHSLKGARKDFGIAVTRNRVYVFGGLSNAVIGDGVESKTVEYAPINYDGTIGEWQLAPEAYLPSAMSSVYAICTGPKIYVAGDDEIWSADVSDEGVIFGGWTFEDTATPNAKYIATEDNLYLIGQGDNNYGFFSGSHTYAAPITNGIIDFNSIVQAGQLNEYQWDACVFITNSKVHIAGGYEMRFVDYGGGNYQYLEPEIVSTVRTVEFTGGQNDYSDQISLAELTSVPIIGRYTPPPIYVHSYFGDWRFLDMEVHTPLSSIDALGSELIFCDGIIKSYVPVIIGEDSEIINISISTFSPVISSYAKRGPYNKIEIKQKKAIVESVVSVPYVLWGDIVAKKPKVDGQFTWSIEFSTYVPVLKSIVLNPQAAPISYITKAPSINSVMSNPIVLNSLIDSPVPSVASMIVLSPMCIFNLDTKKPSISSSLAWESFIDLSIETKVPAVLGRMLFPPSIDINLNVEPNIDASIDIGVVVNGRTNSPLVSVYSTLESTRVISIDISPKEYSLQGFIQESIHGRISSKPIILNAAISAGIAINVGIESPNIPIIRSSVYVPDTYSEIEFNRGRLCGK